MADAEGNRYGPYDIEVPGSEAEALTEDAWFDLFGHISGVKSGGELTFNGLTANLSAIDARVHGSYLIREDPWSDASPPTETSAPRRDLLVARRQRTSGEGESATPGKTFLTVLRGTPAATPADPDHDPDDDELLFSWLVPGSGGTVITDVRDHRRDGREAPIRIPNMAARPTTDRYLGTRVQPRDRPTVVWTWDGRVWVPSNWDIIGTGNAPAGSYLRLEGGTNVITSNAAGAFTIPIPVLGQAPFKGEMWAGDTAADLAYVRPTPGAWASDGITGDAYRPNGTIIANLGIRVNWRVYGYSS